MAESIKKRYRIIIITGLIFLAIPVTGMLLIRLSSVQTYIIQKITSRIGSSKGISISIGSIHLSFIKSVSITDLLVLDNNNDTLIYTSSLKSGIRNISRSDKSVHLGRVTVMNPVFKVITDSTGSNSLNSILQALAKDTILNQTGKPVIRINQIDITGGRFILQNNADSSIRSGYGIDFSNMAVNDINAVIEDFSIQDDTTSMSFYRASFTEISGFSVNRFSSRLIVTPGLIQFEEADIHTYASLVNSNFISLSYDYPGAFRNFGNDVRMKLTFGDSFVDFGDLSYFIRTSIPDPGPVAFSGTVTGTLSELRGRNIKLSAADITSLNCDFDFSGLPDIENTYIFLDVSNLTTRLTELVSLKLADADIIPENLDREAGRMTFRGTFSGFTTDFVTYGRLFTSAGTFSTDISFRPSGRNLFRYQGLLQGNAIEAGKLSGNPELLGRVNFHLNVDGVSRSFRDFDAILEGQIDSADFMGYVYRDIRLNGNFTEKTWDGSISMNDENLEFDFLGMLDFQKDVPEFDFSLNIPKANLFNLNISKTDETSSVNMLVTANFTGNSIDNASGEMRLLNSTVERKGRKLEIFNAALNISNEENSGSMNFTSDFLSANLQGEYSFSTLPNSVRHTLSALFPSLFKAPGNVSSKTGQNGNNKFTLQASLNETDKLNEFFETGLDIAEGSEILIAYDNGKKVSVEARSGHIILQNNHLTDVALEGNITDSLSAISISSESLNLAGRIALAGFSVDMSSRPDSIITIIAWDDRQKILNKGSLGMLSVFSRPDSLVTTAISVEPSGLWVRNDKWSINPAVIRLSKERIIVDELLISSENDYYRISGIMSAKDTDSLKLEFAGIDLGFLNQMWESGSGSREGQLHLALGGIMSGKIILTGLMGDFMLETDKVIVEGFRMIDHEYGNIYLNSVWDNPGKIARIELYNELEGTRAINIGGYYDPQIKELNLEAQAQDLPVDILNPVLSSFASGIKGYASGKIRLKGKPKEPVLTGSLFVRDGAMRVDYLQTQYTFNDSIRFDKTGILFSNINVLDDRGNTIRLNGLVKHTYFNDFGFDITFNPVQAKLLDTRQKDNDIFYGTAFATGVIAIRGSEGNIAFDISAKTDRNTRFYVPFSNTLSIGDYSFVTFTSSDLPVGKTDTGPVAATQTTEGSLSLNFDLDVTPDAEVQLVLDAKAGDVMRGRGSGKLNMNLTPKGTFTMSGDYIISSGDYLFTLGNIVNKRFNVDEGSRLSWNGDVSDADIDIRARYRLETSLYDLLHDERFKDRIPVECLLHMTGKLLNPVVSFDINLPTADEQTRSYVRNAINTEEEMIRQFVYLLAVSRFYSDPAFKGGSSVTPTTEAGMSAIGNTMEMLSNQITNWLSQISNDFDVGFVYRPGNEISPQEVELALSTQILNDRVAINGNFDVGANQATSTATTVTGVFDVEVTITEKLKFKFFNRSNDNLLYETSPYTQGIGIFFRHEFDSFRNLFRRRNADAMKKEDEPVPVDSNTGYPAIRK